MDPQKLQYVIELIKQGDGAKLGADDLNLLAAAAEKSSEKLKEHGEASGEASEQLAELKEKAAETLAVLGVTVGIEKMIEKYTEAAHASANLDAALKANGQFSGENSSALNELAEAKSKVTTSSKEEYQAAEALMISYGMQASQMPKVMAATADLAAMMHTDLHSAAFEVAKAFDGETTALTRMGFSFDGAVTSGDRLGTLMAQIQAKAGGMAEAFAATPAGKLLQLKAEATELEVALGQMAVGGLMPTIKGLTEMAAGITGTLNHSSELRELGVVAFGMAGQIGTAAAAGKLLEVTFTNIGEDGVRHFKDLGEAVKGVPLSIQVAVAAALLLTVKETSEKYLAKVEAEGQQSAAEGNLAHQNAMRRLALNKKIDEADLTDVQRGNLQDTLTSGFSDVKMVRSGKSGKMVATHRDEAEMADAQREAMRQVTEALSSDLGPLMDNRKPGERGKPSESEVSTTQKEQRQGELELADLDKQAWLDKLDNYAKERAQIELNFSDRVQAIEAAGAKDKLSEEEIAAHVQVATDARDKLIRENAQKQADAQTALDNQVAIEQARLTASTLTGYAKLRAEEDIRYQEQINHIRSLRDLQGNPLDKATTDKMLASASAGHDAADNLIDKTIPPEAQQKIRVFEEGLVATMVRGKAERVQAAQEEYDRRVAFYGELLKKGDLTEQTLTKLTAEAAAKRGKAMAEAVGAGGQDAELLSAERTEGLEGMKTAKINEQFAVRKANLDAYYDHEIALAGNNASKIEAIEQRKTLVLGQLEKDRARETQTQSIIMTKVEEGAEQQFSSGFANASVNFVASMGKNKAAFQDFAASLLKSIAQMILQMEVLAAIKAVAGMFGGGGISVSNGGHAATDPGSISSDAKGGIHFAAAGAVIMAASGALTGVQSVDQATYFPSHNVIAGEAGKEMMAVLSNPTQRQIGGLTAMVGSVNGNRLAIVNESDLMRITSTGKPVMAASGYFSNPTYYPAGNGSGPAGGGTGQGGGPGGTVTIEVMLGDNLEARLVNSSIEGAAVRILNDVNQTSALSTSIKNLQST